MVSRLKAATSNPSRKEKTRKKETKKLWSSPVG
jgi:hypothetical protein